MLNKFYLKSHHEFGLSLVETIISLAVLAVGALVMLQFSNVSMKTIKTSDFQMELNSIRRMIISNLNCYETLQSGFPIDCATPQTIVLKNSFGQDLIPANSDFSLKATCKKSAGNNFLEIIISTQKTNPLTPNPTGLYTGIPLSIPFCDNILNNILPRRYEQGNINTSTAMQCGSIIAGSTAAQKIGQVSCPPGYVALDGNVDCQGGLATQSKPSEYNMDGPYFTTWLGGCCHPLGNAGIVTVVCGRLE